MLFFVVEAKEKSIVTIINYMIVRFLLQTLYMYILYILLIFYFIYLLIKINNNNNKNHNKKKEIQNYL